jgi:hypothetical protein
LVSKLQLAHGKREGKYQTNIRDKRAAPTLENNNTNMRKTIT